MARYTVIGASGFVGARLAASLAADGCEVVAPGRDDPRLFTDDLGAVFYCAGLTADYLARPFDTVEAHVSLIARLLQRGRFERLVYLSSTRVYDWMALDVGREEEPLRLIPSEPRHLYDLSKALGENLCLTQSGGRASVARLSSVWDWNDGAQGFLSEWMQAARRRRSLSFESSTGYVRDYVHLDDTVAALRAILDSGAAGIFNVASGENVSNSEIAEVFERCGWSVAFTRSAPKQAAPQCSVERIRTLGVEPVPVRRAIETRLTQEDFLAPG